MISTGDYQRLIWAEPQELREREVDYYAKFMEYITENKLEPLPEYFTGAHRHAYRYLQGSHWDNAAGYQAIIDNNIWR
mgnify:CR=1 FL=1